MSIRNAGHLLLNCRLSVIIVSEKRLLTVRETLRKGQTL